jgi:hypothetical protein
VSQVRGRSVLSGQALSALIVVLVIYGLEAPQPVFGFPVPKIETVNLGLVGDKIPVVETTKKPNGINSIFDLQSVCDRGDWQRTFACLCLGRLPTRYHVFMRNLANYRVGGIRGIIGDLHSITHFQNESGGLSVVFEPISDLSVAPQMSEPCKSAGLRLRRFESYLSHYFSPRQPPRSAITGFRFRLLVPASHRIGQ